MMLQMSWVHMGIRPAATWFNLKALFNYIILTGCVTNRAVIAIWSEALLHHNILEQRFAMYVWVETRIARSIPR